MDINKLYLKTAFCCMACDGNIAKEEIQLVKDYIHESDLFNNMEVEKVINEYISSINNHGTSFIKTFLDELKTSELLEKEQLQLVKIAIQMIEADNEIQYDEVKFFKRIRACLSITDEQILQYLPGKDDYLLPDVIEDEYEFSFNTNFSDIKLNI